MKNHIIFCLCGLLVLMRTGVSCAEDLILTPSGKTLPEACEEISDGGTIYLEPGTYTLADPLVLRKNVKIIGKCTDRGEVVLKGRKENVLCLENGFIEVKNMTIKNLENSGNSERICAVLVYSPNCVFENCLFTAENGSGFIAARQDSSSLVTNCAAQNCGFYGFLLSNGTKGKFMNCEAGGNTLSGILIQDNGTDPMLIKCRFVENQEHGICTVDGAHGTFSDCEAVGNRYCGITVENSGTDPKVENCRFSNNQEAGIHIVNGASGRFTQCESNGNSLYGIQIRLGKTAPVMEKCRFANNRGAGMDLKEGACGTFTDCESVEMEIAGS